MSASIDLAHFWLEGDAVTHAVALLLLVLSVASWTVILAKAVSLARLRRRGGTLTEDFWRAPDLDEGLARLRPAAPFAELGRRGAQALRHFQNHPAESPHLDASLSVSELVTRALRQGITRAMSRLESGQTFLASVGSTAPFVGLFGTVWGIYHALARIGATGQASLEQVAGPVGEALIMTAAGLFVALPAVTAYNAFNRSLRMIAADLDGFAHDLHTFLATGRAMPTASTRREPAQVPARVALSEAA